MAFTQADQEIVQAAIIALACRGLKGIDWDIVTKKRAMWKEGSYPWQLFWKPTWVAEVAKVALRGPLTRIFRAFDFRKIAGQDRNRT